MIWASSQVSEQERADDDYQNGEADGLGREYDERMPVCNQEKYGQDGKEDGLRGLEDGDGAEEAESFEAGDEGIETGSSK